MGPGTRYPTSRRDADWQSSIASGPAAWAACRAWACLGRVAQSLLAASQPGESHDDQRGNPANTELDKSRESEAH